MRKLILTLIMCNSSFFCVAQGFTTKQTLIPLDNIKGVPFYKDNELNDLVIDGFEIDNKGNFYFMGGDNMECLVVFSADKQIFRKTYKECPDCHLYIYKDTLYTFNRKNNDLIVLNLLNGAMIKKYDHITLKHFNSYMFVDSCLIGEVLSYQKLTYEQYSLRGKYVKQVPDAYNVPQFVIPEKYGHSNRALLGTWNDNFVFWGITGDNLETQTFWLVNKEGKVLATKSLTNKNAIFGRGYAENHSEDRKVRNGSLYILGRKGKDALITEAPLDSFFGK